MKIFEWDSNKYKEFSNLKNNNEIKKNWYKTLISEINKAHNHLNNNSNNKNIFINKNTLKFLEEIKQFNKNKMKLGDFIYVNIDEDMKNKEIYVTSIYNDKIFNLSEEEYNIVKII